MTQMISLQDRNHFWLYDPDVFSDMSTQYFTPRYWQERDLVLGNESGRGTTWFVQHNSVQLVLRHYLRGGLANRISRDRYLFHGWQRCRSVSEARILATLRELKLPVPRPVAAQVIRHRLHYRADILIERIPDAQDLLRTLELPQKDHFYIELGRLIARFHGEGVYHADLNIQNILYDKQGRFWLIDFDRAKQLPDTGQWKHNTLERLHRSFRKEKERAQIHWSESDWLALLEGYESFSTSAEQPTGRA